jgi:hypothetical protein
MYDISENTGFGRSATTVFNNIQHKHNNIHNFICRPKKKRKEKKISTPGIKKLIYLEVHVSIYTHKQKKKDTLYITTSDRISKVHKSKYNNKIILQYEKREKRTIMQEKRKVLRRTQHIYLEEEEEEKKERLNLK